MRNPKEKFLACVLAGLMIYSAAFSADFAGVKSLADRRVPWLSGHLVFKSVPKQSEDWFTLKSEKGNIVIEATGASAAAFGLNWYLKYYCRRSMSHMGDNLSPVFPLPEIDKPVTINSAAQYRYALNYCTYNYTMSFYTWKDWQHELDWMALNGVNVMLVANGEEAVWQNVLKRLDYSGKEINDYITGPAYNAWWLMGNIQGWGGPMPQSQIDSRKQLVQEMLRRMKQLGIQPVMPAFYGMVPSGLKNKVKAHIVDQGDWSAFVRPGILDPADPLFAKIAHLFYDETKKIYGKDIHFFSGDPFHEGGKTDGIDLGKAGVAIQQAMQKDFPGAIWVLQGWQSNPRKEMLAGVNKQDILIQELFGENTQNWEDRKGYESTPFIWCTVTNFGERPGINGKLQRFADEIYRAGNSAYKQYMKGVGIMPEGIDNNPVVYELMMELAWHSEHVNVNDWIKDYIAARYGKTDKNIDAAWQLFLQTVYSSNNGYAEGPPENILCARPDLKIKSTSSWGNTKKKFDIEKYKEGVQSFVKSFSAFKNCNTYQIDAIDFIRQDIADDADTIFKKIETAFEQKNKPDFAKETNTFLHLIDETNDLLNTNDYYQLSTYLKQAEAGGNTIFEKKNNFLNALMLITYWGGNNPNKDNLHEYAYKEWGGLMNDFYKKRWQLYFDSLSKQLNGEESPKINFFQWERNWVKDFYTAGKIPDNTSEYSLGQMIPKIYNKD